MRHLKLKAALPVLAALAILACDQYTPPGPEPGDHTPPSPISVVGWDRNHVVILFDEPVTRESADDARRYKFSTEIGEDTTLFARAASLHSDNRTVTLSTGDMLPMRYTVAVSGVSDMAGNRMLRFVERGFLGTIAADVTPPEVAYRSPAPGTAGVSPGTLVLISFTEAVNYQTFVQGFDVAGEDVVRLASIRSDDLVHYFVDLELLQLDASYDIAMAGIQDLAGNVMSGTSWTFHTGDAYDTVPPVLVKSRPANNALNVNVDTDLQLTFSEPMDPFSVILRPHVNDDGVRWSNGGRTVTYETTWFGASQYTVQIRPGEMRDASGNRGTDLFTITFSTGSTIRQGSFSGTITGDPNSATTTDPSGGLVFAGTTSLKPPQDLYNSVVGFVDENDAYVVTHLNNRTYYPFYVADSNGDRLFVPKYGDAVGIYGVNDWHSSETPVGVTIANAPVTGINFVVYDPSAVFGFIYYDGILEGPIHVGLFDTAGFDPVTSVPVVSTVAERYGNWDYVINSMEIGQIPAGDYYVAAFRDNNANGVYDPANDPMGVYGDASPVAIELSNGSDAPDASLTLKDPLPGASARAIRWPQTPRSRRLSSFLDAMLAGYQQSDKASNTPRR